MRLTSSLLLAVSSALLLGASAAAEPAIIGKARAFLGSEDALNAVTSVHMVGTMTRENPADPTHPGTAQVEIIVERPYKFRVMLTTDKTVETDGLNGYDGWHRHEETDPAKWKQVVAGAGAIHQMRANIWQNLAFYRPIDSAGPQIADQGEVQVRGVTCEKVAFIHDATTTFYRFFDTATGQLVSTTTGAGSEIREEGELHVAGIRFPQSIVTTFSGAKPLTVTLSFSKITVNEVIPDSIFAPPEPRPRPKS